MRMQKFDVSFLATISVIAIISLPMLANSTSYILYYNKSENDDVIKQLNISLDNIKEMKKYFKDAQIKEEKNKQLRIIEQIQINNDLKNKLFTDSKDCYWYFERYGNDLIESSRGTAQTHAWNQKYYNIKLNKSMTIDELIIQAKLIINVIEQNKNIFINIKPSKNVWMKLLDGKEPSKSPIDCYNSIRQSLNNINNIKEIKNDELELFSNNDNIFNNFEILFSNALTMNYNNNKNIIIENYLLTVINMIPNNTKYKNLIELKIWISATIKNYSIFKNFYTEYQHLLIYLIPGKWDSEKFEYYSKNKNIINQNLYISSNNERELYSKYKNFIQNILDNSVNLKTEINQFVTEPHEISNIDNTLKEISNKKTNLIDIKNKYFSKTIQILSTTEIPVDMIKNYNNYLNYLSILDSEILLCDNKLNKIQLDEKIINELNNLPNYKIKISKYNNKSLKNNLDINLKQELIYETNILYSDKIKFNSNVLNSITIDDVPVDFKQKYNNYKNILNIIDEQMNIYAKLLDKIQIKEQEIQSKKLARENEIQKEKIESANKKAREDEIALPIKKELERIASTMANTINEIVILEIKYQENDIPLYLKEKHKRENELIQALRQRKKYIDNEFWNTVEEHVNYWVDRVPRWKGELIMNKFKEIKSKI